jgi:hypothetical protein
MCSRRITTGRVVLGVASGESMPVTSIQQRSPNRQAGSRLPEVGCRMRESDTNFAPIGLVLGHGHHTPHATRHGCSSPAIRFFRTRGSPGCTLMARAINPPWAFTARVALFGEGIRDLISEGGEPPAPPQPTLRPLVRLAEELFGRGARPALPGRRRLSTARRSSP